MKSGQTATVTITLVTEKTLNADGHKVTCAACEKKITANVTGLGDIAGHLKAYDKKGAAARIGKLGILEKEYKLILSAISKIETHPIWVADVAKKEANLAEHKTRRAERKENGYCEKCGSYCFGDCES